MKIFIELPTWLGDSTMATPAIENIVNTHPQAQLTLFGTEIATSIFKYHPQVEKIIIDKTREGNRLVNTFKLTKKLGSFEYAISLRSTIFSKILLFFLKAKHKANYKRIGNTRHQVIRYNDFINQVFNTNLEPKELKIYTKKPIKKQNILGINPGATYGSAKRYYPEKFAIVINQVADKFDSVLIFGSENEKQLADDIEKNLIIDNYQNLAGSLNINELIENIASLDTFITADSGPMHIAASFGIKTLALFGPTKDDETSPWSDNVIIIKQDKEKLNCQPCMQRTCSQKHHKCMQNITAKQIIKSLKS
jgi:heptosyltransferase-2